MNAAQAIILSLQIVPTLAVEGIDDFSAHGVTIIGILVGLLIAFAKGWIVTGSQLTEMRRDRDLWMQTAMQAAHVSREQGITNKQMAERVLDSGANELEKGPE